MIEVKIERGDSLIKVYSIFASIQGESTSQGRPTGFVRLAGCPLSCSYCDTREACESPGRSMTVDEVLKEVSKLGPRLVEVTGGEPLAQSDTQLLLASLCDAGYEVMVETSGAFPIERLDPRVRVVMDVKCPGSGMTDRMRFENLDALIPDRHELKFVISSKEDFEWAVDLCRERGLDSRAELLVSPVYGVVTPPELAGWVLSSEVPLRLQIQLNKVIWPEGEEER